MSIFGIVGATPSFAEAMDGMLESPGDKEGGSRASRTYMHQIFKSRRRKNYLSSRSKSLPDPSGPAPYNYCKVDYLRE